MNESISFENKQKTYNNFLKELSGIYFTIREIDVMACLVHNRGGQNIANLLSVAPRTVGAHIHNIRTKLKHIPKDAIIDFVEKSGKLQYLKQYYCYLLTEILFEEYLERISRLSEKEKIIVNIKCPKLDVQQTKLLKQLKIYLQKINRHLSEINS